MELALLTGMRRENVCNLRFTDVDRRRACSSSTNKHPKGLSIKGLGPVIERALQTEPACPYIVAKQFKVSARYGTGKKSHRHQVLPDYLTRAFGDLVKANLTGDNLPTFHEIRSLTSDQYRKVGWSQEQIKTLLGHEDIEMTEHYQDGHEVKFERVTVGLDWR